MRVYKRINLKHPDNREGNLYSNLALTLLIANSKELGLPYDEYNQKLQKLEREVE